MVSEWKQIATVQEGGRIEVHVPRLPRGQSVEVSVRFEEPTRAKQPRRPGSAKGRIRIHADFDEPLPEFVEYI